MRELGYVPGRDIVIEWRFAEAKPELYAEFAAELVRFNADIFLAGAAEITGEVMSAAKDATKDKS